MNRDLRSRPRLGGQSGGSLADEVGLDRGSQILQGAAMFSAGFDSCDHSLNESAAVCTLRVEESLYQLPETR